MLESCDFTPHLVPLIQGPLMTASWLRSLWRTRNELTSTYPVISFTRTLLSSFENCDKSIFAPGSIMEPQLEVLPLWRKPHLFLGIYETAIKVGFELYLCSSV